MNCDLTHPLCSAFHALSGDKDVCHATTLNSEQGQLTALFTCSFSPSQVDRITSQASTAWQPLPYLPVTKTPHTPFSVPPCLPSSLGRNLYCTMPFLPFGAAFLFMAAALPFSSVPIASLPAKLSPPSNFPHITLTCSNILHTYGTSFFAHCCFSGSVFILGHACAHTRAAAWRAVFPFFAFHARSCHIPFLPSLIPDAVVDPCTSFFTPTILMQRARALRAPHTHTP